jgi:hypothetical protein
VNSRDHDRATRGVELEMPYQVTVPGGDLYYLGERLPCPRWWGAHFLALNTQGARWWGGFKFQWPLWWG